MIYNCNANCGAQQIIEGLSIGKYHLVIKSYTADWKFICRKTLRLQLTGSDVEIINDNRSTLGFKKPIIRPVPAKDYVFIELNDFEIPYS